MQDCWTLTATCQTLGLITFQSQKLLLMMSFTYAEASALLRTKNNVKNHARIISLELIIEYQSVVIAALFLAELKGKKPYHANK